MRNKIIKGNLNHSNCDDEDMLRFLKLLKKPRGIMNSYPDFISEKIFVTPVKQLKKQSVSSIFSRHMYAVHKCAILYDRIRMILILFYNTILKQRYCPKRWQKILEICIKKGRALELEN